MKRILKTSGNLLLAVAAMSGYRIDRLIQAGRLRFAGTMVLWGIGVILTLVFAVKVIPGMSLRGILLYNAAAWLLNYAGNYLILATRFRVRAIERFGEETAYRIYEAVVGLMFINQGLAFNAVVEFNWIHLPAPSLYFAFYTLGVILIVTGSGIKIWATMITGSDIYYYMDMFTGRAGRAFAATGPYRYFSNPMYGAGNLHLYGLALIHFSFSGLIAAVIYHTSIYGFYFLAERPAVKRLYKEQ